MRIEVCYRQAVASCEPGRRKLELPWQLGTIDGGDRHGGDGAVHIDRESNDGPVIFRIVYRVAQDDAVAVRNYRSREEESKSLQGAAVFGGIGLTHCKHDRIAQRWVHNWTGRGAYLSEH